jgi:hypothetical protein
MTQDNVHKLITAVMTAQILQNQLFDLKVNGVFKHRDKMIVSNCIEVLTRIEAEHYDGFFNSNSKSTSMVYESYERFLREMAKVPIYDCELIINLYNERRSIQPSEELQTGN